VEWRGQQRVGEGPLLRISTGRNGSRSDGRASRSPPVALVKRDTGRQIKLRLLHISFLSF